MYWKYFLFIILCEIGLKNMCIFSCEYVHLSNDVTPAKTDRDTRCLFVWCLTARQHRIGQFVPTAGGWNRLSWLRMANETQCIIRKTLHNVTQFTIKHSSYKNATTDYLDVRKYYLVDCAVRQWNLIYVHKNHPLEVASVGFLNIICFALKNLPYNIASASSALA